MQQIEKLDYTGHKESKNQNEKYKSIAVYIKSNIQQI